ncbi:hypothetical protein J6590_027014 [Homalodisca vitripennis]|nr:hypothetical protein J6590_027014 [Homalodisca vitripennis]
METGPNFTYTCIFDCHDSTDGARLTGDPSPTLRHAEIKTKQNGARGEKNAYKVSSHRTAPLCTAAIQSSRVTGDPVSGICRTV